MRIKNRQNSLTSFWKWQWSWVGWSNSGQNKLSMEAVLECMQEDIEFMRTFFISWICLLVPREITSVLSAFVLIAVALFTCHFLPKSKSDKNSKQRGKRVEKEEKNPGKSAARDLLNSYLSSASVAIQAPWRYISSIAKKSTTKCEHRNEDQTCVCCDYQLVQHKYSFSRVTFYRILMLLIICAFIISIPWEYIRLFQNEVAKRMAVMEKVSVLLVYYHQPEFFTLHTGGKHISIKLKTLKLLHINISSFFSVYYFYSFNFKK